MNVRFVFLIALAAGALAAPAACGGKILDDPDGTTPDAAPDVPYEGEWCNDLYGPDGGDGGDWVFCAVNPYLDAWTHCHFIPGASGPPSGPWGCCTKDSFLCCPGAVDMWQLGDLNLCCESENSCQNCCNGIGPGPAYQ